jgi:hypothetical protein
MKPELPDSKAKQGHHKKEKLHANIPNEYRCKNTSKPISST